MTIQPDEALRSKLAELKVEHRDLDQVITRMTNNQGCDDLQMRRLKKRKLALKDSIAKIESRLIPDLNA